MRRLLSLLSPLICGWRHFGEGWEIFLPLTVFHVIFVENAVWRTKCSSYQFVRLTSRPPFLLTFFLFPRLCSRPLCSFLAVFPPPASPESHSWISHTWLPALLHHLLFFLRLMLLCPVSVSFSLPSSSLIVLLADGHQPEMSLQHPKIQHDSS